MTENKIKTCLTAVDYKNASTERLLEFVDGYRAKKELQTEDVFGAMEAGLVIRLVAPSETPKEITTHGGDLTQLQAPRKGKPSKAYGMWREEFEDYFFAPEFEASFILYNNSAYMEAESIDSTDFGGGDSI